MEGKNIKQILKQYLLGNAREEEVSAVDHWYQSFENNRPLEWSQQEREATKQEIWEKIAPDIIVEKPVRRLSRWVQVIGWAAAIAGIVLTLVLIKNRSTTAPGAPAFATITTNNGQRSTITMKDGTRLTLNAGTTLHVYNDFSTERKIELVDGEVFFNVQRDITKPFVIQSSGLTITVLGTSFNVLAYSGLKNVSVGVVSGKVSVTKNSDTLGILQKNKELVYNKERNTYTTGALDESLLAWTEGRLVLNDVSFNEMVVLMKKNFGIDVLTNDAVIRNTKYTTELFTTMTPVQAMEVLAAIHNLKIKEQNNQIILLRQ